MDQESEDGGGSGGNDIDDGFQMLFSRFRSIE